MTHESNVSATMKSRMDECIALCLECARACEDCGAECVSMEMKGMAECIAACRDCADLCLLDAQLMSRNSPHHFATCATCADACERCAAECERLAKSHPGEAARLLETCAKACRACGTSCRAMSEHGSHEKAASCCGGQ